MTSVLNVDTIADKAGTGPVGLTKQSAAKSWSHSNLTSTPSIGDSVNLSSITDNGNADFTWNWSNNFNSVNYTFMGSGTWSSSGNNSGGGVLPEANITSSAVRARTYRLDSLGALELVDNMTTCHGDLA